MTGTMRGFAGLALGLVVFATTEAKAQPRRGGGMMMGGGRGYAALLLNEGVQKELKLNEEQVTKATDLAQKSMEKMREAFSGTQDLEPQERMSKMMSLNQEISAGIKKEAAEFLKPDQLTRLTQIEYQNRGPSVFRDPEVLAKLKVTDDQKAAIKDIEQEAMDAMLALRRESSGDFAEMRTKMTEIQKTTTDKIEAKLTEDQKKTWKEMVGAPFEVRFMPRQRRQEN